MISHIKRFNVWYDKLPPVTRFLTFMGMMCAAIIPLEVGIVLHHQGMILFGLGALAVMTVIATIRAFDISHRGMAYAMAILMIGVTAIIIWG